MGEEAANLCRHFAVALDGILAPRDGSVASTGFACVMVATIFDVAQRHTFIPLPACCSATAVVGDGKSADPARACPHSIQSARSTENKDNWPNLFPDHVVSAVRRTGPAYRCSLVRLPYPIPLPSGVSCIPACLCPTSYLFRGGE